MCRNFSFIRPGAKVRWNDPAIEDFDPGERKTQLGRVFSVVTLNGRESFSQDEIEDDDIVLLSDRHGDVEALPTELEPALT